MTADVLKVWVVDDDQSVRWVLEKALKQADMQTRSFERAEHLLEALGDGEPDVLITDVRMPGVNGFQLAEQIRELWPDLVGRVIMMRDAKDHKPEDFIMTGISAIDGFNTLVRGQKLLDAAQEAGIAARDVDDATALQSVAKALPPIG